MAAVHMRLSSSLGTSTSHRVQPATQSSFAGNRIPCARAVRCRSRCGVSRLNVQAVRRSILLLSRASNILSSSPPSPPPPSPLSPPSHHHLTHIHSFSSSPPIRIYNTPAQNLPASSCVLRPMIPMDEPSRVICLP